VVESQVLVVSQNSKASKDPVMNKKASLGVIKGKVVVVMI
jgi:hypothetical protein